MPIANLLGWSGREVLCNFRVRSARWNRASERDWLQVLLVWRWRQAASCLPRAHMLLAIRTSSTRAISPCSAVISSARGGGKLASMDPLSSTGSVLTTLAWGLHVSRSMSTTTAGACSATVRTGTTTATRIRGIAVDDSLTLWVTPRYLVT